MEGVLMFLVICLFNAWNAILPIGLLLKTAVADCREGYIGVNCSVGCRYPSYGKQCQYACNCSKEDCNKFTGCVMREMHDYGSFNKTERQENAPSDSTPLIWITLVGIVCGVFTTIVGRVDGEIGGGENRFAEEAFLDEVEYVDPLAYKREKISQNRESQHLYAPLDNIN
uniref:Uncharacterized protein LOC111103670 n=1 Tax=Crassostrea virginica TaxID=6565 RepID=A0A8B8ANP0_CRAVI|nr:uncharacterized protein LOC111103670 [Crassostrea virginica]